MAQIGNRVEIIVNPGTNPIPDETELATLFYTATDKVYFYKSSDHYKLRKLPGYQAASFINGQKLRGAARSLHSYRTTKNHYIIGTNTRLYTYEDGNLYNITPVRTGTTTIANSLATDYVTLPNNPIATTINSKDVVFTSTAHKLGAGDSVIISGVPGAVNGVPQVQLNTTFVIRSITVNTFTVTVATTAATSTGSGGSNAVIAATALITATAAAHGLSNGDRVKMLAATATGGIPIGEINIEQIVRGVTAGTFDFMCVTKATSSVTGAGGASTTYQKPIAAGAIDYSQGFGYGGGKYGVGLYGVGKVFANAFVYPRIWSGGRYGNDFIITAGDQTNIYIWLSSTAVAPTILSGAPTAVAWVFIAGNIVVALGAAGIGNRIMASDAGDATNWTPGADSYAYQDDLEGAGTFISQASTKATNLLFTENSVYIFTFVDKPDIWDTRLVLESDGLIGPKARIEVGENIYWVGQGGDIYKFDGASAQKITYNTCRDYIAQNLNYNAKWKIYCRHDPIRNQIFIYMPFGMSTEPDNYVIVNYKEEHCTLGTENGTAAEEIVLQENSPYTLLSTSASIDGNVYRRDIGHNADTLPMIWSAETNYAMIGEGDTTMEIMEITPDSTQTGTIDFTIYTKDYAQSTEEFIYGPYSITPTTSFIDPQAAGRQRKYAFGGDELDEDASIGKWFETIKQGPPL